jgi:hypothetical protein
MQELLDNNLFWHYHNTHKLCLEEAYIKLIPDDTLPIERWQSIRILKQMSPMDYARLNADVGMGIRMLGIHRIVATTVLNAYLKPHQRWATANPCTEEEFNREYELMKAKHDADPQTFVFFK